MMSDNPAIDPQRTALLLVDPYNDFLAEGGKLWPMVAEVATSVGLHDNLKTSDGSGSCRWCPSRHRPASPLEAGRP